jgi:hypothetical protein
VLRVDALSAATEQNCEDHCAAPSRQRMTNGQPSTATYCGWQDG